LFGPTSHLDRGADRGVAGSAAGWYWVISRHISDSRPGRGDRRRGGRVRPPMISHANAHRIHGVVRAAVIVVS